MMMEMDNNIEKKVVFQGDYEDIIKMEDHLYVIDKKDRICILPYTLSANNLLDKIGVVQDWNYIEEKMALTLISDYMTTDDDTDLVAANRILYEVIGTNVEDADLWMYLGNLHNCLFSDSPIKIYAVNVSNVEIKTDEDVEEREERRKFKLLDSNHVIQTDDTTFLASFFRLFHHFHINALNAKEDEKED